MLVIAHRGASFDLPENTLPAFERAIEVGADYVELDVHADLSVTHDPPRAGGSYPQLAEVVELCRGRIGLMVELKDPSREAVERALRLLDDDAVLVSFHRPALELVRELRPGMRTLQHVGFGVSLEEAAGAWAVGFRDDRATAEGFREAERLGFTTTVYTVNDRERLRELARLEAGGVFTDRPDLAREVS